VSGQTEPSAAPGHLSPDGYWWWNGSEWVPVAQAQPQPPQPGAAAPPRPVPWMRIAAGATAVVGAVATLVACLLPYGTFPDPSGGPTTTSSIFNGGFAGAGWDVPEPVFAILAGVVSATLVFIGINRTVQAISAGVLLAAGIQSAMMWIAYYGLASTDGSAEAGGVVGVAGGVLLFVAGLLVLAGLFTQPESATPAAETAPAATPTETPAV
jgi:hypothetical protein